MAVSEYLIYIPTEESTHISVQVNYPKTFFPARLDFVVHNELYWSVVQELPLFVADKECA